MLNIFGEAAAAVEGNPGIDDFMGGNRVSGLFCRMIFKRVLLIFLSAALVGISSGQPGMPMGLQGKGEKKAAEAVSEKEDEAARLRRVLKETRDAMERAHGVPAGISAGEKEAHERTLEEMALLTNRSLKNLAAAKEAEKSVEAATMAAENWQGFKDGEADSQLFADGLLNERDALKDSLNSLKSVLANYQSQLDPAIEETKRAEMKQQEIVQQLGAVKDGGAEVLRWRLDAARAAASLGAARVRMIQGYIGIYQLRVSAAEKDLALGERKISAAAPRAKLSAADLKKIRRAGDERKAEFEKQSAEISRQIKSANSERAKRQAEADALSAAENSDKEALELARLRLDAANGKTEMLESMRDAAEAMARFEDEWVAAYQARLDCLTVKNGPKYKAGLEELQSLALRLKSWDRVVADQISVHQAELAKRDSQQAGLEPGNERFGIAAGRRLVLTQRLDGLRNIAGILDERKKLVRRWLSGLDPDNGKMTFGGTLSGAWGNVWEQVRKIWSFEIASFDDPQKSIVLDGKMISGKIPLTIGMVVRAVLFFALGYWIAVMIADRLQGGIVRRGRLAEAHARTLRNWAMIAVSVLLAVSTLSILKIPLTVFAFFGGALAIGLGFGTQTLIKNFISGIIMLVERKVRVGDILDVSGVVGKVVEVNARSSVIRSADDVETMIPNALFLENKVTNWTLSTGRIRKNISVKVAAGSQPQAVIDAMKLDADRHGKVLKNPEPYVTMDDFNENSMTFQLYFWVDAAAGTNSVVVASDLRIMILKRFAELGIALPSPSQDVKVTSWNFPSVAGGEMETDVPRAAEKESRKAALP